MPENVRQGAVKKTRFWGNQLLFHFFKFYVEKKLNDDKFIPE